MGIDKIVNTSAYLQSMQYSVIPEIQAEEDAGLSEAEPKASMEEKPVDMDQLDFKEGDQAISLMRRNRGKGVYETVGEDPALAWSVKRQTYPSAMRINKRV